MSLLSLLWGCSGYEPPFRSIFRPKVLSLVLSLFLAISHMVSVSGSTHRASPSPILVFSLLYCVFPHCAFSPLCVGTQISMTQHPSETCNPTCHSHPFFKGAGCFYFKKETVISHKASQIHHQQISLEYLLFVPRPLMKMLNEIGRKTHP